MKNGIFTLDLQSLASAVLTAVVTAIVVALGQVVLGSDFNVFTANWTMIGENMVNIGFIAGVGSLVKDLLSTNSGSFLNLTPATPSTTPPTSGPSAA